MKLQVGEVFAIQTKIGFGFLQYVDTGNLGIEIVRVLEPIKDTNEINQLEVELPERFTIQFVVKAALRKKILIKTGIFKIPEFYKIPVKARTEHFIRGEFIAWHIVNQQTLKIESKKALSEDDLLISPHGIPNDTLLIERLENNWRLEQWK